jgi:PAS domain S-box-containing protein
VGTSLAAEPLLALAVTVTSERRVDSVLQSIVHGLASQPGVALARIWLVPSADLLSFCHTVSDPTDCLCLVASAGTPINSPGEDWCFLQGHFARMPFNVGKVGQVAATRHPILVENIAAQNEWVVRPEWAKREEIRSFGGYPLIFRDKLLGVIAVFSRHPLGQQEFTWLGLFANQAAVAISNARAEQALQLSERNLRQMINAIPTCIHVQRTDGSVLSVNQAVLDYTGLTFEDVQKEDYRVRVFHPEDVERLREERRDALRHGVPFDNEQRMLSKGGKYRWFLFHYNPLLDEQGRIDRWYVAATDIDDRKQAEAKVEQAYLRLAEAQRLSKTGSFITDLVADDHNWSEEAFRIFDFDPATKVTVQRIRGIIHPEDLPSFEAMIARAMTGVDVDFVFRIVTSRNVMKHIRGMARIMVQDADRPLFIGALQDITESKMAEEALDRARSELARVARITTMNTLTASIAHEIKQPLASLITNASIALRRLNADPPNVDGARETVQRTIRDANRASDVITRLRALFGKKEFTLETLDLNEVTTEVIALSLSDLQRNRVILRSELAQDLPPVIGDRVQLQQVTFNLIRNASDAMVGVEDRPRQLLVRTQRDGDDRVRLSVQDAGCGVNPQDFERLFEAFYTTKTGGMGIGLSVSRSIIERHEGRLWAEPNNGPGTTFFFSIPCGPGSAKDAAA